MIENQISGNQYEGLFEAMPPECNHPEHKGRFVLYVCLKPGCKETRGHCTKCNLKQHLSCRDNTKLYEDIIKEIQTLEKINNQILETFNSTLDQLKKLHKQVESRCEILKRFIEEQSLKNLNEFAEIHQYYSQYGLKKLHQGQEQLLNIFQSHFVQNFIQNIDDSHNIKENNQQQKQNEQIYNVQPIQRPKIISIIENKGNQKYFEKNQNNENKQDQKLPVNQLQNQEQFDIQRLEKQIELKEPQKCFLTKNELNDNIIKPPQQKLTAIDEQVSAQYLKQGQLHYEMQRYAEALEYFDLAIALNPNNPSTWNNKGTALNKLDRDFESIECFDRAREIINSRPYIDKQAKSSYIGNKGKNYVLGIASTLARLGQFQDSIKLIDEGLALDPTNLELFKVKVMTLLLFNQSRQALKIVDEAIQQDQSKQNYQLFKLKGLTLIEMNKTDEGMECLQISNSIKPQKETYFALGKVLVKLCRFDEAESCLKHAIELDKNYYEAIQELEMVQQIQQNFR